MTVVKRTWSTDALDIINKRYLSGYDLTIEEWIQRICTFYTKYYTPEERPFWQQQYEDLIMSGTYFPTSAALHNALREYGSLSGNIVLPLTSSVEDLIQRSMPQILGVLVNGIGVGLDLGVLPPRLEFDPSTGRTYPGPVETLTSIVQASDGIMLYAGLKRAAFMASLPVSHPDIFEFITCKHQRNLRGVNISVSVDDTFYKSLEHDGWLPLSWVEEEGLVYLTTQKLQMMHEVANHRTTKRPDLSIDTDGRLFSQSAQCYVGQEIRGILSLRAQTILDIIAQSAHACGDPGILHFDAINDANPTHTRFSDNSTKIEGTGIIHVTSPCGEQPLLPFEVCHLGSFNLNTFINNNEFDFSTLAEKVKIAVRLMDDIIDVEDNGIDQTNRMSRANRKIGIGMMGLADVLAKLQIPYASEEGRAFAARIACAIQEAAVIASRQLALERGAFPNWEQSRFYYQGEPLRRHATLTTIAPTGHISMLADCSTSIEPYFLLSYFRDAAGLRIETCRMLEQHLMDLDYSLEQWIAATQIYNPQYRFDGSLSHLVDEPTNDPMLNQQLKKAKRIFQTAHEISPIDHLKMIAALQPFVENGISKTINLPREATVADVRNILYEAMALHIKGLTVFRDGCLDQQALSHIEECPQCGEIKYVRPNNHGGLICDQQIGGCGYEVSNI